jgi:nudix-type nucleoside diphosphatase (YffH/AdpP family)
LRRLDLLSFGPIDQEPTTRPLENAMSRVRKAEVHGIAHKFEGFFKVDEVDVSHLTLKGQMDRQKRLVFERGDSVAVLLYNTDTDDVVMVNQFKVPALIGRRRDNSKTQDGWITEAIAGMIDDGETPEQAVIREAFEETGYKVHKLLPICTFFSSPGGTSERIFLYFAEVHSADRIGKGGGIDDEDIAVIQTSAHELFHQLEAKQIEDPKLIIAAYWLQDYVRKMKPLKPSTVQFEIADRPHLKIGYKTGSIDEVTGASIWVNSENTDMMMDRIIGRTVSARIRYLGAKKEDENTIDEDTIQEALRGVVGEGGHVRIGTVLSTVSGMLARPPWQVERILHVATVEGGPGQGVKAQPSNLTRCVRNVLKRADFENNRLWRLVRKKYLRSIVFPMLGAGDGGLTVETVAENLIPEALDYLQNDSDATLQEIYFIALKARDRSACERILKPKCLSGELRLVEKPVNG